MGGKFVCSIVKTLFSEFWQPMNAADIALIIHDEGWPFHHVYHLFFSRIMRIVHYLTAGMIFNT